MIYGSVRQHPARPLRLSKLTAQTVSLITKRLLDDGLLLKGQPQRGKVGRRSLDVLLVDFCAQVRQRWRRSDAHADRAILLPEIAARLKNIRRELGPTRRAAVQGVGIAAPLSLGGWQQLLGLPTGVARQWQHLGLAAEVSGMTDWPVTLVKDTAAACVAELVAGRGRDVKSFLYVFVDTFIGGGLVLDSHLRDGKGGPGQA